MLGGALRNSLWLTVRRVGRGAEAPTPAPSGQPGLRLEAGPSHLRGIAIAARAPLPPFDPLGVHVRVARFSPSRERTVGGVFVNVRNARERSTKHTLEILLLLFAVAGCSGAGVPAAAGHTAAPGGPDPGKTALTIRIAVPPFRQQRAKPAFVSPATDVHRENVDYVDADSRERKDSRRDVGRRRDRARRRDGHADLFGWREFRRIVTTRSMNVRELEPRRAAVAGPPEQPAHLAKICR
jgi:hypothetical protein